MKPTREEIWEHLGHVEYPVTRTQLVEACNKMMDVPTEIREWFVKTLPERTYRTKEEVLKALHL